jgi:hypothetical protein
MGAGMGMGEGSSDAIDGALRTLARTAGLLSAVTPVDAHLERGRLLLDFRAGKRRLPRWTYPAPSRGSGERLRAIETLLQSPSSPLHRARAEELRLEIVAADAAGTEGFAAAAAARYAPSKEASEADGLARRWLAEGPGPETGPRTASDDRHPGSLVSRLRAEVDRRRLPFTVKTSPQMAALAPHTRDTLRGAEGRLLTKSAVDRTVVHELEAHALPRVRARAQRLGIFAIGTARGSDDQEGYALWLEETRGVSSRARRHELASRHHAVRWMRDGADFLEVVAKLEDAGGELEPSLRIAERAFRGSDGKSPGLGRESVYLEALVRVRRALEETPADEAVLAAGQVSVDALATLRCEILGPQTPSR